MSALADQVSAPADVVRLERDAGLRALRGAEFDLLVIGGGITGAGIAREAALAGWSVALLEAHDFAAGTSSRSTKLIHGGLRYLAMGEFALVRAAARERKSVHAMAPHLAEPAWMVIPSSGLMAALRFRVGVSAYERLGQVAAEERHHNWSGAEIAEHEPLLDTGRFRRAVVYREYTTDDARLVLATLRGAAGKGAVIVPRVRVTDLLRDGDRVIGVRARDEVEGAEWEIRARAVVNAAGPWVEDIAGLDPARAVKHLHLSKGVHVVLERRRLPVRHPTLLPFPDGRFVFVIPRGEVVYVGTTDTSWAGGPCIWPTVEAADVDYLLGPLHRFYRVSPLGREEVLAAWAGLRPLIAEPGKAPGEMSRRDEIWQGQGGLVTIAGGKLTGFRSMASEVMAFVAARLEREYDSRAHLDALPGGDFDGDLSRLADELSQRTPLEAVTAARLVRLYGTEARHVAALGAEPVGCGVLAGEIDWAVTVEAAQTLEDVVYRRTRAGMFARLDEAFLGAVAARMAKLLGWSAARQAEELSAVRARLAADNEFRA